MLRRPKLAITILLLLLALPAPWLLQLKVDNAPEIYFPDDNAAVSLNAEVREQFPQDQVLIGLFAGDVYEAQFLKALSAATKTMQQHPLVEKALSVTSLDHIRGTDDGFVVERLIGAGQYQSSSAENRKRVLADPAAPGSLAAEDGSALALIIRPVALESSMQRLAVYEALESVIEEHRLLQQNLTAIAGHMALDVAQFRALIRDLSVFIPLTLGVSLLLLWLLFRRLLVLIVTTLTINVVVSVALSVLIASQKPFTLLTAIMPPLLTAITVAMVMHLFNALCNADANGLRGEARMRSALRTIAQPAIFTALTTAGGLISLMASPIPPIAYFGLATGIAVLTAAFLTIFIIPAIILRFDDSSWGDQLGNLRQLDKFTSKLLRPALRHPVATIGIAMVILAAGGTQIPKINVETDLYAFFSDDSPINEATAEVETRLSGVMPLEIIFTASNLDDLKSPERLEAIRRTQNWLEARVDVDRTFALPELIAEMHAAFNGSQASPGRPIPADPSYIDQYLLFYDGEDLEDLVEPDFRRSRLLVSLNIHSSQELNRFLGELAEELRVNPPADLDWDTVGMGRLFAEEERLIIAGQINSLVLVSILISGLMLLLWRNGAFTVISLLPNIAAVVCIFGLMGMMGVWLDVASAMVASVAIGIAIDDTIHLLHGVRAQRRRGRELTTAIARSIKHRGRALVATTIILAAQFLIMATSSFQPTSTFGYLSALGLIIALLFDLLVLPALLILAARLH